MTLIEWKYGENKKFGSIFVGFRKILIPLTALSIIILVTLLGVNFLFPNYTLAEVEKIAMQNSQIRELIEKGADIKDIEIVRNKAYVLISPKEISKIEEIPTKETFTGAIAEIELREKKVAKIENITPQVIPLTEQEEEKAKKIITESETSATESQALIPSTAEQDTQTSKEKTVKVEKVEPLPTYNLELIKEKGEVKVIPKEKTNEKVKIIYKIDGEKKESAVNLTEEKVEESKTVNETEAEKQEGEILK